MEKMENTEVNVSNVSLQKRTSSPLFWVGMVSAVYEAVLSALVTANVEIAPWVSAVGVGLAAVLVYCNGNNPCMTRY